MAKKQLFEHCLFYMEPAFDQNYIQDVNTGINGLLVAWIY